MTLKIKPKDVLGVFVLDEFRLPAEDFEKYIRLSAALELFFDDWGKPSFLYHYQTADNHDEYHNFELGFFTVLPEEHLLEFAITEQFTWSTGGGVGYDTTRLRHHRYDPPKSDVIQIIKRKGFYFKSENYFYVPVQENYFGTTAEDISRELRSTRDNYHAHWMDSVKRYAVSKLQEGHESVEDIAERCGVSVNQITDWKNEVSYDA
jgi:hypothetical protein